MYVAQPGDVLVVFAGNALEHGYWGEVMSTAAQSLKLGGLVIDGGVRDVDALRESNFPVFASNISMRGTGKDFGAIGWINFPIRIGEVTIAAGDLIVGDTDGVVAIPTRSIADVLLSARQREDDETEILARIKAGERTTAIYGWE